MSDQAFLRVLTGSRADEIFGLSGDPVIIGRELSCDFVLEEAVLSRRHCRVERREDGKFHVEDLNSKNGTYLNGQKVDVSDLQPGDVIRLGACRLEFDHHRESGDPDHRPSEFYVRQTQPPADSGSSDPLVGVEIGRRYKAERKIGEGGMGRVYKAADKKSDGKIVAVKLMNKALMVEDDQVQRFKREFDSGQELIHSNIVQTLDFGMWDDTYYIVMEFVAGRGLQDILDVRGRLSPRGAIKVAMQVTMALEHAFKMGIIHRDIKPDNILITPNGVVKLLDLGLAKKIKDRGPSITKSGEGIGTLHYMAPEQTINARDTDQRSDIYALGATMYHMLCGEPPFDAEGVWEFVDLIQHQKPEPLTDRVKNLPDSVWKIVQRALEKHPRDRFQTPTELREQLEAVLETLPEE
jgi:serine/threonine protein kinase